MKASTTFDLNSEEFDTVPVAQLIINLKRRFNINPNSNDLIITSNLKIIDYIESTVNNSI